MIKNIPLRIGADILILICLLQSWWLAAFAVAIISAWFFPYFIELVAAGIIFDALYGMVPDMGVWGYISTIEAVVVFGLVAGIRSMVRK